MITPTQRRHSRWYEMIIFNQLFLCCLGYFVVICLPAYFYWGNALLKWPLNELHLYTLAANSLAYGSSFFILRKLKCYPGTRSLPFIIPSVLTTWLIVFSLFVFMQEAEYSTFLLSTSFILALIWAFIGHFLAHKYKRLKLAIVPYGRALELEHITSADIELLDFPSLADRRFDGVVADLHASDLPAHWQTFLAECTLARIPVFHSQHILESLTGRVKIHHLSENIFGELLPSALYGGFKRTIDVLLVFLVSPIFLPIMLITALLIKFDGSDDGVFYNQERMGFRGKSFKMYKFRSMRNDITGKGFTEGEDDPRITPIGKIIRKFRIDEMPQILNVLKGDMSFIGPRPESLQLSQWYEKDVPFFSYRHTVRPGISGWAQVSQGYAAEVEGMTIKLEYDFYYIKHFSLWLDILIIVKTIKTMLTGFGAR